MRKQVAALCAVGSLLVIPSAIAFSAHTWLDPVGSDAPWYSIAMSDNGQIAYAGQVSRDTDTAKIWKSTDGAVTWSVLSASPAMNSWRDVVTSADGTKIVAYGFLNGTYTTKLWHSSDAGETWSELVNSPNREYSDLAMSSNGQVILAGTKMRGLFRSTNGGNTWTEIEPLSVSGAWWTGVTMSSDGLKMMASHVHGSLWQSVNGGTNWSEMPGTNLMNWWHIAMSADGSRALAVNDDQDHTSAGAAEGAWLSVNSGATWTRSSITTPLGRAAISRDGSTMAVSLYGSEVRVSRDSGATWESAGVGTHGWMGLAISAGGERIVAVPEDEKIRIATSTTTTTVASVVDAPTPTVAPSTTAVSTTAPVSPVPVVTPSMVADFVPKPIVAARQVTAGDSVLVRISGFEPFELVSIGFEDSAVSKSQSRQGGVQAFSARKVLATVRADATGTISVNTKLPTAVSGSVTLWAYGSISKVGFKQAMTVAELPRTGSPQTSNGLGGVLVLVVTGLVLLGLRRQLRT